MGFRATLGIFMLIIGLFLGLSQVTAQDIDIPDSFCPPLPADILANIEAQADVEETTLADDFKELSADMAGLNGYQFVLPDDYVYLGNMTYLVPDNDVNLEFALFNGGGGLKKGPEAQNLPEDARLRMFVLFNDHLLDLDGDGTAYTELVAPYLDETRLKIRVEDVEDGVHRVAVVTLPDENYIESTALDFIMTREILSMSITFVVGDPTTLIKNEEEFKTVEPGINMDASATSGTDPIILESINNYNTVRHTYRPWGGPNRTMDVAPNQDITFDVLIGYQDYEPMHPSTEPTGMMPFLLMVMIDDEPVETFEFGSIFYGQVDQNTFAAQIPVTIAAPNTLGRHQISVLVARYPETPRCFARDPLFARHTLLRRVFVDVVSPAD